MSVYYSTPSHECKACIRVLWKYIYVAVLVTEVPNDFHEPLPTSSLCPHIPVTTVLVVAPFLASGSLNCSPPEDLGIGRGYLGTKCGTDNRDWQATPMLRKCPRIDFASSVTIIFVSSFKLVKDIGLVCFCIALSIFVVPKGMGDVWVCNTLLS